MSVERLAKSPEEAAQLALALTRLVEASKHGTEAIDRLSFRVDNELLMPALDVLEHSPFIKHDNDFYQLRLAALLEVNDEASRAVVSDCDRILAILVQHYRGKETRSKQKLLSEIAKELNLSPERVVFCVDILLEEGWAWVGGNGNRTDPFEARWIKPGENILRHKTVATMLPTLSKHIESMAADRLGIRRAVKKISPAKKLPFRQALVPQQATAPILFRTPFDSYEANGKLGEGGSSTVYKVKNASGEVFAVKVLKAEILSTTRMKRFRNEASFCQRVNHPNILKVLDWGLVNTRDVAFVPFIVVPLYPETLRDRIRNGVAKGEVLPTFAKILDGVEAAHLLGVLHRDIKPENVLVNPGSGDIVVADFGIAHFAEEQIHTAVETRAADRLANFQYAAPEQKRRDGEVGFPADVYALGLVLNELFTSEVIHGTGYRTVASVAPEYGFLDALIESMVRQRPNERPQSIREVKQVLIDGGVSFVSQQRVDARRHSVVHVDYPAGETRDGSPPPSVRVTDQPSNSRLDEIQLERGFTRAKLLKSGDRDDAFLRLAQLRAEGVEIRNGAATLLFTSHLDEWIGQVEQWMEEVIETLKFTSAPDSEWFATLDTVPQARIGIPNVRLGGEADREVFVSVFRQHDYRLARLDGLLRKYGVGGI